jgi:hypothetical protein
MYSDVLLEGMKTFSVDRFGVRAIIIWSSLIYRSQILYKSAYSRNWRGSYLLREQEVDETTLLKIYCGVPPRARSIERPLLINGYAYLAV